VAAEQIGPGVLVRALVRLLSPAELHEELLGDLTERHARIRAERGRLAARVWIWKQVARLRPLALRRSVAGENGEGRMGGVQRTDLRHALRALQKRPGFVATIVVTVAVAVGSTTAVFSVVNGVLLRPLDVPEPEELVLAWQTHPEWLDHPNSQLRAFGERFPLSVPTFRDWQEARTGLESLGIYTGWSWVHLSADGAEVFRGLVATSGAFTAMGVAPAMGRALLPEDDQVGAASVAVLSHELWRDRFGSDPDILGRVLTLRGTPHAVVGVMPPGFQIAGQTAQLWTDLPDEQKLDQRDSQSYTVIGRLRHGATPESVEADLVAVQKRLSTLYPDEQGDNGARVEGLQDVLVGGVRSTLWFLLAAVGLVLAIACVNIANMLSVTGLARRRELAVKAALGATRARLVRGMLLESGLLGSIGGGLGVALTALALPVLVRLLPATLPRGDEIGMDARVLAFGLLVTGVTSLLVGALPALQVGGTSPRQTMDAHARGLAGGVTGQRVRSALVIAEVAMAFLLLVGAALLGTSFARLWTVDRGFDTEGLVSLTVVPDPATYPEKEDRARFTSELGERLAALPGVRASATNQVPLTGSISSSGFEIERSDGTLDEGSILIEVVLPGYLDVMGIPLLEGRPIQDSDLPDGPPVAVVNQELADRYFPGESALGRHLRDEPEDAWITVIGVAANVRHQGLHLRAEPKVYVPSAQSGRTLSHWVMRVQGDLEGAVGLARSAVAAVSPSTPVSRVQVLDDVIARSVAVPRFRTLFVVGLATMATLLSLLGIYGVVAFAVSQRTRELAVRVALGAASGQLLRRTLASGLRVSLTGVALGGAAAWPIIRYLDGFLFEVEPGEPRTWVAAVVLVTGVALLASWIPARRASRVDPVSVLSAE
jgi:putative ABC transport system permease protein